MRSEEIVKGYEQGNVGVRSRIGTITIGNPVGELESTVESLDNLFEPAILFGHGIIIGKTNHLGDIEPHTVFSKLVTGQEIDRKAIGNEFKSLAGELFELVESHSHCEHTRGKIPSVGNLVTKDGFFNGIHDEPDVVPDLPDFDVCFIGGKEVRRSVIKGIHKWFDNGSGGFGILGNRHMGDMNTMDIAKRHCSDSCGETEVDAVGQAKAEDVRREFPEVKTSVTFRHGVGIHLEKVHGILTVVVPQLESFRIPLLLQKLFVGQAVFGVKIERTMVIATDMNNELVALTLFYQGSATVRTPRIDVIVLALPTESKIANLAKKLPPATGVIVQILVWSTAAVTDNPDGNCVTTSRFDRRQRLAFAFQVLL